MYKVVCGLTSGGISEGYRVVVCVDRDYIALTWLRLRLLRRCFEEN